WSRVSSSARPMPPCADSARFFGRATPADPLSLAPPEVDPLPNAGSSSPLGAVSPLGAPFPLLPSPSPRPPPDPASGPRAGFFAAGAFFLEDLEPLFVPSGNTISPSAGGAVFWA